jgi:class 3 adenylate cyclase
MAQASGGPDEPHGLEGLITGSRRSPLELLVGRANYTDSLIRESVAWGIVVIGGGVLGLALAADSPGMHPAGVAVVVIGAVALLATIPIIGRRTTNNLFFFTVIAIVAGPIAAGAVWAAGPELDMVAVLLPSYTGAVFLFFSRRTAALASALGVLTYAGVVAATPGYARSPSRVIIVTAAVFSSGLIASRLLRFIESMATSERDLHGQLSAAHAQLETRVNQQVEEIDRLSRLRRFLSPQVADTVLSSGGDDMLATHRRQIAVIFLDLRGFTSFSAVAEPEDVMEVLTEFYAAVGEVVKRLDATVGGFAGDGVMAYFNDPFPCEDPAGRALDMAMSLRDPMAILKDRWRDRGYVIGYGAGIAFGYATLGTIGFEERTDYTPIGSVVNLASRLCDEAADGEVLLDRRAHTSVRDRVRARPAELTIKGFAAPVTAYRVSIADPPAA